MCISHEITCAGHVYSVFKIMLVKSFKYIHSRTCTTHFKYCKFRIYRCFVWSLKIDSYPGTFPPFLLKRNVQTNVVINVNIVNQSMSRPLYLHTFSCNQLLTYLVKQNYSSIVFHYTKYVSELSTTLNSVTRQIVASTHEYTYFNHNWLRH